MERSKPAVIPGLAHSKDIVAESSIKTNNGILIGAIGVSGASADQDEQCAAAAIKAVEKVL